MRWRDFEWRKHFVVPNEPFDADHFFKYLDWAVGDYECPIWNPKVLKKQVHRWSELHLPEWQRIVDVWWAEYEPLWNYDRTDEETISRDLDGKYGSESSNKESSSSSANGTADNHVNENVAGYDSGGLVENSEQLSNSVSETASNSESEGNASSSSSTNEDEVTTRKLRAYGNIGVMSSQDLLKSEIEVAQISIYEIIVSEFKDEFCILVY